MIQTVSSLTSSMDAIGATFGMPAFDAVAIGMTLVFVNISLISLESATIWFTSGNGTGAAKRRILSGNVVIRVIGI